MPASPLVPSPVHVTEAIVRALEDAGVDTVFGMSGGNTGRIHSALAAHTDTIRSVLVRNEAYATSAAEAYARHTGKVAVAMAQGSWLMGQGVVGTLEALFSGTPIVLLGDLSDGAPFSQHAPYQSATGEYGSWDARLAFKGITKLVLEAHDPVAAVQSVQLAVKHALAGQPGPVAVLFHSAALVGEVGPDSVPRLYSSRGYLTHQGPARPDMAATAEALRTASAPVLLAGGGVRTARVEGPLLRLARATGAPVVTTSAGKGVFPEEHPQAAGVFGNYGVPLANDTLGAADTVLVLGSKLGPSDTALEAPGLIDPARQRIIHVDIEELNAGWTMPTSEVIVADLGAALDALLAELGTAPVPQAAVRARSSVLAARRTAAGDDAPYAAAETAPLHPQRAVAGLREALPDDVVICADAGENRLLMCRYFESRAGGGYLQPAGAGGMGYAIPAAIGVKTADPDRTVVAVCGDGGFSMSLGALLTTVEERLPVVVVVLNNGILGWVKHSQRSRGEQEYKSTLYGFDYTAIGRAAGLASFHVAEPAELAPAMAEALKADGPALVVVDVSTEQTFTDLRTPLMG
ncbi:thiamine pyrophosphate-binding protein [Actinacidiphila sp. ITFR-21]|uniref:thiamine pyrophosphate-binding protein n=1 Tax=Actinacidiphila sp. ITFR-21 TaxID=3075199 RepID=UPI00288B85C3|nr:thiamine pyrophosphate-binding protein [Streptomyces sp. ITFR-21]WNI16462.1 thiamine pyrophosphate-binding protein [Streptomyces sp. ITFR-21]